MTLAKNIRALLRRGPTRAKAPETADTSAIWSERARNFGRRSVYNLSIRDEEFDEITQFQENELFPLLSARLFSPPKNVLDYGCGAGRFTASLRALTKSESALGFDPCPELITMAVASTVDPQTSFLTSTPREFFDGLRLQFDLVWIATVLGGIADSEINKLADDITLALRPGGLLFFAENTAPEDPNNSFWRSRPEAWYEKLFNTRGVEVAGIGLYESCGSEVSVFAGRKCH